MAAEVTRGWALHRQRLVVELELGAVWQLARPEVENKVAPTAVGMMAGGGTEPTPRIADPGTRGRGGKAAAEADPGVAAAEEMGTRCEKWCCRRCRRRCDRGVG